MSWTCNHVDSRAPNGDTGPTGGTPPAAAAGTAGTSPFARPDGSYDYAAAVAIATHAEVMEASSLVQLQMLLHDAEQKYLTGQHAEARARLIWLVDVNEPKGPPGGPHDPRRDSGASGRVTDGSEAIYQRAMALLNQLDVGADYFGLSPDHVPLVSLAHYESVIDELLDDVADVEKAAEQYWANAQHVDVQLRAVHDAVQTTQSARASFERLTDQLAADIGTATKRIAELLTTQENLRVQLDGAADDFKRAVERKVAEERGGCDFLTLVSTLTTVATVASSVWTAGAGIVTAVGTLGAKAKDDMERLRRVVKVVQTVGAKVSDIAAGYRKLEATFAGPPALDTAKLLVVKEDFEETIKPYLDLPETRAYRGLVRNYLDVVQARNQALLDRETLYGRLMATEADLAAQAAELAHLRDQLAATADPSLAECAGFMRRAADALKFRLLTALYFEHKAFEYWALRREPFDATDRSVAHLRAVHARLKTDVLRTRERRNRPPQRFHSTPPIELLGPAQEAALAALRTTGRMVFEIPRQDRSFRRLAEATVDRATITIDGARSRDTTLTVLLTHNGHAQFTTTSGAAIGFSHTPRLTFAQLDVVDGKHRGEADLGGADDAYAYLSPFAQWTLELSREDNDELDLSTLRSIQLVFHGFAVARP